MKACRSCTLVKPLGDFPPRKGTADGRRNECVVCARAKMAVWREGNRGKVAGYTKKWAEANPEIYLQSARKSGAKSRLKYGAAWAERSRKWRDANPDKSRELARDWSRRNTKWKVQYLANNREAIRARSRLWAENNRAKVRAKARFYQAMRGKATPPWLTPIHRAQIQETYDVALALSVQTGIDHHVDHLYPLKGRACCGLHVPWNLQVLPAADNLSKNNRQPSDDHATAWG